MNDWWNYLAHSEVGGERKGHKYYARVVAGTDRFGRVRYRYFYDAREYGAYKTRKQQAANRPGKMSDEQTTETKKANGRTNIITGWGNTGLPSKSDMKEIKKTKPTKLNGKTSTLANGVRGFDRTITFFRGATKRTSMRTVSVKTVKNKKSKKGKSIYQRGKDAVARLITHNTNITFLDEMSKKDRAKVVKNWGKKNTSSKNQKSIMPKNTVHY